MTNRKGTALTLHKFRNLAAKVRAIWHTIVLNRDCELCYDCGRPYLLWWCGDQVMWSKVTGYGANGLCCPQCFGRLAEEQGLILEWRPVVFRESRRCGA